VYFEHCKMEVVTDDVCMQCILNSSYDTLHSTEHSGFNLLICKIW
jgi:hypothetical protein